MPVITMEQVAAHAGVSKKTVSRVINNEKNVSTKTQEKVRASIEQLDYMPNISARSLRADRSYVLGLVYDNPSPAYVNDLQEGALDACNEYGFGLLIHPCNHVAESLQGDLESLTRKTRIDGLMLTPPLCDREDLLDMLDRRNVRYVRISPLERNDRSPVIFADECSAARMMTNYLISQGHERIGFITGHPNRSGTEMRLEGYKQALAEHAIPLHEELIEEGLYSFESGEAAARRLLRRNERPTAIFASNDYMAAGIIKVANQMRINIPYELSVCGYDDAPVAQHVWPALTTIRHPVRQLARLAAEALVGEIMNQPCDIDLEQVRSDLVVRESTGPCRG